MKNCMYQSGEDGGVEIVAHGIQAQITHRWNNVRVECASVSTGSRKCSIHIIARLYVI